MNGRTDPSPIKDWRKEQQSLTAAKYAACERYYALQDEIRSVEQLRTQARARRILCVRTYRSGNRAECRTLIDKAGIRRVHTRPPFINFPVNQQIYHWLEASTTFFDGACKTIYSNQQLLEFSNQQLFQLHLDN